MSRQVEELQSQLEQCQRQLRVAEARFHLVAEGSAEGLLIVDGMDVVRFANPAAEAILGRQTDDLVGEPFGFPVAAGEVAEIEIRDASGQMIVAELDVVETEWQGEPACLVSLRETTPRRPAEERVHRQAQLLEAIEQSIVAVDLEGRVIYWNRFAEEMYGRSAAEVMGRPILEIFSTEQTEERATQIMARLKWRESWSGEFLVRKRDGTTFPVLLPDSPVYDDRGVLVGIVGLSVDITRRKQMEEALRESELRLRTLFEEPLNPILIVDEHGHYVDANRAALEFLECDREELLSKVVWDFLPPGQEEQIKREHTPFVGRRTLEVDYYVRGRIKTLLLNVVPMAMSGETVLYGIGQDITERKRAEEALRRALRESRQYQEEMKALLASARAILEMRRFEKTAPVIFAACKELIGARAGYVALLTPDSVENEVLFLDPGGLPCTVDPDLPMPIRGLREQAFRTSEVVYHNDFSSTEYARFLPEGHARLDNVLFAPLLVQGRPVGLLGLANKAGGFSDEEARIAGDFAEMAAVALLNSRTLESLEESEERYRTLFNSMADAIFIHDLEGHFLEVNRAACKRLRYSREELFDMTPMDVDAPEYAALVADRIRELRQRGHALFETVHVSRDGVRIPIELSSRIVDYDEQPAVLTVARDITERKRVEETLARQAEELARSNAELEQFAYVASHDLREPLRAMTGFLELLERRYGDRLDEKGRRFIGHAVEGAVRMQDLIDGLLVYSRVGSRGEEKSPIDCEVILEQVLADLAVSIEESDAVISHDPLPVVLAEESQLRQVFQNLIGNAVKFHDQKPPRVHVSARRRSIPSALESRERQEWLFSVRDNGIGIDPEQSERIFGIFQRLHTPEEYPGTGVGLSICKKIVERHGGRIWVESEIDVGSIFYFTIPDRGGES